LKRHGLHRPKNWHITATTSMEWKFVKDPEKLRKAAENFARFFFILHGAIVHVPDSSAPYNLLVSSKELGENQKIQVKSSYNKESKYGGCSFSLVRSRHNSTQTKKSSYKKEECDYFFLLDMEGSAWLIPFESVKGRTVKPNLKFANFKIV
jgi:hypothetical protein